MGERSDRIRRDQHHRLPHRRRRKKTRQGLPGRLEKTRPLDLPRSRPRERLRPGGTHVRRRFRAGGSVQQDAEEEAGRVQEQHEEGPAVQQREQGAGM